MRSVCVFCGSSEGNAPGYREAAASLGRMLASRGCRVVYGGGSVGLMGVLADAALAAGGEVVGVIPHALAAREVGHPRLTQMHVVNTMHQRKALMAKLSDAFIAMPGGIGTLEELFEIWSWAQLGVHTKPCGLLNVKGYFDQLLAFLDSCLAAGFIPPVVRAIALADTDAERLLDRLRDYAPPSVPQWVSREET